MMTQIGPMALKIRLNTVKISVKIHNFAWIDFTWRKKWYLRWV